MHKKGNIKQLVLAPIVCLTMLFSIPIAMLLGNSSLILVSRDAIYDNWR